jgi:hypothetical protein
MGCCWHCHTYPSWHGYGVPPAPYPPAYYEPPPEAARPRAREHGEDDIAAVLRDLREQVSDLRREMDELRRSGGMRH